MRDRDRVLAVVSAHPGIQAKMVAAMLIDVSAEDVRGHLGQLREQKKVKRVKIGPNAFWAQHHIPVKPE